MSLCAAKPFAVRPVAPRAVAVAAKPARGARVVVYSAPDKKAIQEAIKEAEETCAGGAGGEW